MEGERGEKGKRYIEGEKGWRENMSPSFCQNFPAGVKKGEKGKEGR